MRSLRLSSLAISAIFGFLLGALAPANSFAQLPPCTDLKNCGEIVTKPRVYESIGIPTQNRFAPDGLIPAAPFSTQKEQVTTASGELEAALKGHSNVPKSDFFHGNDDFNGTWDEDMNTAIDKFNQCQSDANQHTLDDLTNWIYPFISAAISTATGWGDNNYVLPTCITHYGYSGPVIGSCWFAHQEDCNFPFDWTFCGCVYGASWQAWDLIEYYYPTGRVNVSEQPFQSKYLETKDYDDGKEFMESSGYKQIGDNMKTALSDFQGVVKAGVPNMMDHAPELKFGTWTDKDDKAKDKALMAIANMGDASKRPAGTEDPRFRNTANHYMEGRYYTEDEVSGIAGGVLGFLFIPHYPKYSRKARVITDPAPENPAWAASVILQENEFDSGRWGPYLSPKSGVRGANCIENNKSFYSMNQKTPDDFYKKLKARDDHDAKDFTLELADLAGLGAYLNPISLVAYSAGLTNSNVCLDNVGEIYPYTHYSRLHPTDQIFAASIKMAQYTDALDFWPMRGFSDNVLFTLLLKWTKYHTFVHQWDKFQLLDDPGFTDHSLKDEIEGTCATMEKGVTDLSLAGIGGDFLAKRNVDMSASVVKAVKGASEATFEIYSLFKGCYKPGVAFGNFALPPHGETEFDWGGPPRDDCTDVTNGPCWQDHDDSGEIIPKGLMRTH